MVAVMGSRSWLAVLLLVSPARPAFAQGDTVTAEALFQQGRALLDARKLAEACPKLAESLRLDPATGTLIALALCHESEGKLASAWAEFSEAEGRSRNEGRKDREQVARERAEALQPRLSSLTIDVSPEAAATPGVEVKRDGFVLGRGAWGTAVPIDGGEHQIEVTAPGKVPWTRTVTVNIERDHVRVAVPALVDASVVPPAPAGPVETHGGTAETRPAASPAELAPPSSAGESRAWGTLEWVGVGAAAGGVIALGAGGYFLMDALDRKKAAEPDCNDDNQCNSDGLTALDDAVGSGNMATLFSVVGGVLVGGGATLFLVGRAGSNEPNTEHVSVSFGSRGARLSFERHF